jgi:UDP-N-acetylmuramyl pentapeptide synthase
LEIPELSKGMQKNLVLAVLAASELGISPELISERLPQYRPSTLRANRFQGRGRTYFIDCYNANPSSMRDTLSFFFKKFKGTPKLYILGGMEELGDKQVELHEEVGLSIRVESNDLFVMIGEKAGWFAKGLLKGGADEEQLVILDNMEAARSLVEDFQGSVLLKGSRSNRLENLLPAWAVSEVVDGNLVEC